MEDQPVRFKLSYLQERFWKAPKPHIDASDGQRYHIFQKHIGCNGPIIGLRQNGVSKLRLKPKERGLKQTIEVRTCAKPWQTTATLVFGGFSGQTLELPTFHLEMQVQTKNEIQLFKNEAFFAKMDTQKSAITVYPGFLDIAEELLLLSYWIWVSWANDIS